MRVVLLGGSFNPIHNGHLQIMLQAMKRVHADEGWFVLAGDPPLKDDEMLDFKIRKSMIHKMIQYNRKLRICDIEKELPTPSYTVNTLRALREKYPSIEFYFLIGSDQGAQFDKWKEYREILKLTKLLIYPRDGYQTIDTIEYIPLEAKTYPISSTDIRLGRSFETHPAILQEIALKGYYGVDRLNTFLLPGRVDHSIRVAELSAAIARKHNLDEELARSIGLAHDLLKEFSRDDLKIYLKDEEMDYPEPIWHAFAGARYHSRHYYVKDKRFLNAIYHHTLGNSSHSYSQILFIADKCEPGRNNLMAETIINKSMKNLNEGFKQCKIEAQLYYERKKNESN